MKPENLSDSELDELLSYALRDCYVEFGLDIFGDLQLVWEYKRRHSKKGKP